MAHGLAARVTTDFRPSQRNKIVVNSHINQNTGWSPRRVPPVRASESPAGRAGEQHVVDPWAGRTPPDSPHTSRESSPAGSPRHGHEEPRRGSMESWSAVPQSPPNAKAKKRTKQPTKDQLDTDEGGSPQQPMTMERENR